MTLKKWKTISRQEILNHPRMHLVEDEVELPNGKTSHYLLHAPTTSHSVIIVAVNHRNELLLQKEYSYPPNEIMWQLPGGSINEGEDVIEAAMRELREESDLTSKDCKQIGFFYTNNRRSDQKQYVVICSNLKHETAEADPEEFIESSWVPISKVEHMMGNGEFHNMNTLAALAMWLQAKIAYE